MGYGRWCAHEQAYAGACQRSRDRFGTDCWCAPRRSVIITGPSCLSDSVLGLAGAVTNTIVATGFTPLAAAVGLDVIFYSLGVAILVLSILVVFWLPDTENSAMDDIDKCFSTEKIGGGGQQQTSQAATMAATAAVSGDERRQNHTLLVDNERLRKKVASYVCCCKASFAFL